MLLVLIFAVIFISQLSSSDVINTILVPLEFQGQESIIAFGEGLMDPVGYALPFELASLLLLGALVGGVYIAMDKKGGKKK
jgi:NADH:ubiquinone oxidoreductase subunit 6 (subunit J)